MKKKLIDQETKIETIDISALSPYSKNPRSHPASQIEMLAKAIRQFGFLNPIIIDDKNEIVAGHGRFEAAKIVGLKSLPAIRASHLTPAQIKAFRVADNQLASLSVWDDDGLREILQSLQGEDIDFDAMGFTAEALAAALAKPNGGLVDPDDAPPVRANPAVRLGDVWLLGSHRVLCGDSTKADDVARVMGKDRPQLMVTDPPYGVDYDPNWRNEEAAKGNLAYADRRVGVVKNDDRHDWREAWALFTGDVAYCWHAGRHASSVQTSLESTGLMVRSQIIWAKSNYPISRGHYHWRHEPCWYAVREGRTGHWQGARDQTTLWQINLDKNVDGGHSTQKPVECMRLPIINNSAQGEYVYDPFVGSGTTLIASEMEGRHCLAIELDPAYCQVTIERWEAFSGLKATLEDGGQTLEQVTRARRAVRANGGTNAVTDPQHPPLRSARRRARVRAPGVVAVTEP